MKLSQFTLFIEDHPQVGHHLLYNTLSRSLIEINDQCLHALYSIRDGKQLSFPESTLQKLKSQGFIVEEEPDENELYLRKFHSQRASHAELHATILTTYQCPMACVYCYQRHIEDNTRMSESVMEKVIDLLKKQIQEQNPERCLITYYGGEPLMNLEPVDYISGEMRTYCKERNVKFNASMVTSGLLLNQKAIEALKNAGIRHLQITLDGDRETHDSRRRKKDGSGTFDDILDNIRNLPDGFYITISCNVDTTNKDAVYNLIDLVSTQDYARKVKRFIFGPVTEEFQLARRQHIACPMTNDEDLVSLSIHAAKRGFIADLRPEHILCGMLLSSHFVIDPIGGIYTCPSLLGMEEYSVANIKDYINLCEPFDFELHDKCLRCSYVPICNGGCRYNALVERGDIHAIDCQKDRFSNSLPLMLKTQYHIRNKDV